MGWVEELYGAARRLRARRAWTAVAILTLGVGIGAETAVFSVVYGVLLAPLPFPQAERLYGLWHTAPGIGIPKFEHSSTTYVLYREHCRSFVDIGLSNGTAVNLTDGGEPVRLFAAQATASWFSVLGVPPQRGRVFTEEDVAWGGPRVVVLGDRLWRSRFGADPTLVGRTIHLDGTAWEVIGVMPPGFAFPYEETELWLPLRIDPESLGKASFNYEAVGRLRAGVTPEAAEEELNRVLKSLPEAYPGELTPGLMENARMRAFLVPLRDDVVGDVGEVLWVLLGAVAFVLLIAVANVANLFLVRAEGRQREIGLRAALGAGPRDLARSFLVEAVLLALAAGAVGLVLAAAGLRTLLALAPEGIPRLDAIGLHGPVVAFDLGVSALAGIAFGLIPILRYRRPDLARAIHAGTLRASTARETHRTRSALAAAQVALALVLLVASGLMARTYARLRAVPPGFATEDVLTLRLSLPEASYPGAGEAARFYLTLLDALDDLPRVEAAGAVTSLPLGGGGSNNGLIVEDFPLERDAVPPIIRTKWATPGYFEAMGIPLLEGRTFETRDIDPPSGAVVVNEAFARRFWQGESALGKRVKPGLPQEDTPWYTIVGVVGDVRDDGLEKPAPPIIYYAPVGLGGPYGEWTIRTMSLAVRSPLPEAALLAAVRETIWRLDPALPLARVRTTRDLVARAMARTTYTVLLLGIAAAVALLLGTVGLYAVIAYVVAGRTREIGVRMALGARRGDIGRMVVRQGLVLCLVGIALGIAGALGATRLLSSLLFGVEGTDAPTFAAVVALLLGVGLLAAYLPARRAAAVDPLDALRYE